MFTTDSKTELYLKNLGVHFDYREDVAYDELVDDWNVVNRGRPQGQSKVAQAIASYSEQMRAGSAAPAVILRLAPNGSIDVLDGIQRLNANLKTGASRFCAYLVVCSDDTAHKMRIAANIAFSSEAPVDPEWATRELVIAFMIDGNDSAKDIASVLRRSVSQVSKVYSRETARRLVDSLWEDGKTAPSLRAGEYDAIAELSDPTDFEKAADPLQKFVSCLHKCGFKNGDSVRYIGDFFGIKRIGNKNRKTQFNSKLKEFRNDPIVKGKLAGSKKLDSVSGIDNKVKALKTVLKNHAATGSQFDNLDIVRRWNSEMHEILRLFRKQCTTEVRRNLDPFVR